MARRSAFPLAVLLALAAAPLGRAETGTPTPLGFGETLSPGDLGRYVAIPPSGAGLPPGQGDPTQGKAVYESACASCHGESLGGVKAAGAPALIGGRGTLAAAKPVKTVESYWPYATTLFDYIRRAMPFNAPGSLTDDQVYAVTSYILARGGIIAPSDALDATRLPRVQMPNREGFIPDPRPRS
jgi:S-disulfanyl-L-cysteine oxidoreductase SoxD